MNVQSTRSFALAAAAAALLIAGCAQAGGEKVAEAKIHCGGVNACKGQTDCKSAENSCKGQNSCKGHGFKALSKTDCDAMGGHEIS
ncbi:MAG TPA: hypothetical protein VFF41_02340 [Gallionella sp.]|nr:hypothetical protein [Gallionella sp.]